jgi:hypothetical protein
VKRKRPTGQPALFETRETNGAYAGNGTAVPTKTPRKAAEAALPPNYCKWPGCPERVPRKRLMCAVHWYRLPNHIRERLAEALPLGQCAEYDRAIEVAVNWIMTDGPGAVLPIPPTIDQVRSEIEEAVVAEFRERLHQEPWFGGLPGPDVTNGGTTT